MRWELGHSYLDLPALFYTEQAATPVAAPRLAVFNQALAARLGLQDAPLGVLAGNETLPGSRPFAQAYAGHQYAHFTMLGDGRALVLGEVSASGGLFDLQLKGSGRTPYSRSGDGRAALGPMLREYLMGEAMHALGIPTTRALAVVETGEPVRRETTLPGAVLTRVAASHLRVGTFEYAAATEDLGALRALTNYAIGRHYPQAASAPNPAAAFLGAVIAAQARLIAQWMSVGFVHGVMNTDNMAVSGETIDYGPCAFLDTFRAGQVYSSIDRRGRYAFANQPGIAQWNLTRLAEALLPVLHEDASAALELAQGLVDGFGTLYQSQAQKRLAAKLGLEARDGDGELVDELLAWMEAEGADFTLTFRALSDGVLDPGPWSEKWKARLAEEDPRAARQRMNAANPVYIPRNHRVEAALDAAVGGDYAPFHTLLEVLSKPFEARPEFAAYEQVPPETDEPFVTYCGT